MSLGDTPFIPFFREKGRLKCYELRKNDVLAVANSPRKQPSPYFLMRARMGKKNQSIVVNIFITLLVVLQGCDFTSGTLRNKKSYLGVFPRNFTRSPIVISLS